MPIVLAMALLLMLSVGTLTIGSAYGSKSSNLNSTGTISTAESVYQSESVELPTSIESFIILIANEAHESWQDERHKLITDKNSYYIPKNLVIPQGTTIAFLNADAPWDTPYPQTIEIKSDEGEVVYTTGVLEYTNSSKPTVLPVGNYTIVNTEYDATEGTISVTNEKSNGNLVVGGFYTPTDQVENNKEDNDGGVHPGSLDYHKTEFPKNGFQILSECNFTYGTCGYCPGKYWPDNKIGNHTLIIFATEQPFADALIKLKKLVKDNVYV
jgi:hypothetical protein